MKSKKEGRQAFLFYIDDWLSSTRIAVMSASEERAYLRLLLHAAKQPDGGLPNDAKLLAEISKLGKQWKGKSGRCVADCFVERDGRLYNTRLCRELDYQNRWRARRERHDEKQGANGLQNDMQTVRKTRANVLQNGSKSIANELQKDGNSNSNSNTKSSGSSEVSGFINGGGGSKEGPPPRPSNHNEPDHAAEFARLQAQRDKEREAELHRRGVV